MHELALREAIAGVVGDSAAMPDAELELEGMAARVQCRACGGERY